MFSKALSQYLIPLIGVLITFGFGYLPPIEPISVMGMKVLGIFLGMIFLWSFSGVLWSSLLGIVALGTSGFAPMPKVLAMSFGDTTPALIFFVMILFGAIQQAGITRYIARWFLTRKVLNGRPFLFSFVFMYTAYVLAILSGSVMPVIMLMWGILYSFLDEVGYKKDDRYTAIMVVATFFGSISGQAAKPFTASALMVVGAYEKVAELQLNYLQYMFFGFILCSLGIVLFALFIKFVLRPDVSKIANISVEQFKKNALPAFDARQKIMAVVLALFMILILLPSIVPASIPGVTFLNKLGPLGVTICFVFILCLGRVADGPILNFKEIASKHVVWEVYLLVCMIMAISKALVAPDMGIIPFLTDFLNPILGGHSSYLFFAILITVSCCITQFANNAVLGVMLMPIIAAFTGQNGANFEAAAVLIIFSTHIAILTPAASPFAAILYANTDWINRRDVAVYGACAFALSVAMYVIVGIPVANMIYG